MNRGDVWDVEAPGVGRRPAVIVTRDTAIPILRNVTVAVVTTRIRDLPSEVPVGREHGLRRESAVNCDNLFTVPKDALVRRRGHLTLGELQRLDDALAIALGLDR